jgi:hypothetical protein
MGSSCRRLLNQSTHSRVAYSTVWPPGVDPLPPKPWSGGGRSPRRLRRAPGHEPVSVKAQGNSSRAATIYLCRNRARAGSMMNGAAVAPRSAPNNVLPNTTDHRDRLFQPANHNRTAPTETKSAAQVVAKTSARARIPLGSARGQPPSSAQSDTGSRSPALWRLCRMAGRISAIVNTGKAELGNRSKTRPSFPQTGTDSCPEKTSQVIAAMMAPLTTAAMAVSVIRK